eukprot:s3331_g6.t1
MAMLEGSEQLGGLFARLGLLSLVDSKSCLKVLRPWNRDSDVEAALSALVASTPQAQLPASMAADLTGLAHWTPQARLLLAQKLTQEKPPEVPGGAANYTYLEALSWQPYADVEAELKRRCSSSSPDAREAGLRELMKCASRDRDAPVAVRDALSFFEVRLRNEQDNVRAAVLQQMAKAPVLLWQDVHVNSLRQLLTSSMQAKGSSSESLSVWRQLVEVFVANGAALPTEFGLGPCGAFGMEVRSQMTAADLWDQDDAAFGTSVLSQVARLEPQQAFLAFPWLVGFLRPSIRALLDSGKVDQACALLARWDGTRLELLQHMPDIPDACAAFDVLLRETFATATQDSRSFNPFVAKAAQDALRALLLPSYAHLNNSKGLTWAQEQAVRRLCQLSSSWWQSLLGRIGAELPWHTTLALEFLGSSEARHLQRRNRVLFDELVQALCTNWDVLAEWQRAQFAAEVVRHLDSACRSMETCLRLAPLLHRLCDWPFSLALAEPGTEKFGKSVREVGYKIRLRCQAEEMLARHKPLKASFLEGWRRQEPSLQAERLCTSAVLLRAVQHKPKAIQLLVGLESRKLQQLRLLQASGAWPLHFFGQDWTSNRGPRPFFSWPAPLQRSFAEAWLALGPLGLPDFVAGSKGASQVREKCRLRLALPALSCEEELGGVLEACVEVLKSEEAEDSTALAVARGRAGQLLDRLIPVLARADRAKKLAPLLSAQLGQGNSKQVARSFQVLLRRLGSRDASATLEAAFRSPLKVAERVALLRDSSEHGLLNRDFEPLLESLYESHRDVGGAVLVALCRMGQTSLLTRVSQDEGSLYQLQILLRQLSSPTSELWNDEVAGVLATLCQRPDLGEQCLRCLSDWALSEGAHDASTVAAVASAASEALTSKTESFWLPAARCLVCLARLDSGPLVALLRQLLADCDAEGADLLQVSARLRILTNQLSKHGEASEATLLAAAAAAFRAPSVLAKRSGLELWAVRLHWKEPGKVLEALQLLPSLDRILLPVLLFHCYASLKSQQPQGSLRETAQVLLEAETEPALVMLMAVVKFLFSGNWPGSTEVTAWATEGETVEKRTAAEFLQALVPRCRASASLQLLENDLRREQSACIIY